jgi:hypothetical protein
MSALNDKNRNELSDVLSRKIDEIYGLTVRELKYPYLEHSKRSEWLLKFANVTSLNDFEYLENSKGDDNILVRVKLDDVVYQQYLKVFERDAFEDQKTRAKLVPPKGW